MLDKVQQNIENQIFQNNFSFILILSTTQKRKF